MLHRSNEFLGAMLTVLVGGLLVVPTPFRASLLAAVPSGYLEETVATVTRPVAMAFLPDGRLLVGSQGTAGNGQAKIHIIRDGVLLDVPYATVTDVSVTSSETGLLGLTVDPNFATNGYVYAFITVSSSTQVVRRFRTVGDLGTDPVNLITGIPTQGGGHNGGGLLIHGNYLYVSVGENGIQDAAQLTSNWLGKVLRFNLNGTVPTNNPFGPGNAVYAYGLRNPFRLAARPGTDQIFATENGPAGYDEINQILPGANYGWPLYTGYTNVPGFTSPVWSSGNLTGIVPTDLLFYQGTNMPEYTGQLFVAGWSEDTVFRATVNVGGTALVGDLLPFITSVEQPVDLEVGSDGTLWYCTRAGYIRRVRRNGTGGGDGNVPPTPFFTVTPSGPPPLTVVVNGSASTDSDGSIRNYHWDWGDGTSPRSGPTRVIAGHVYDAVGTYTITLTITDDDGASASTTRQVVVSLGGNSPPSAHIEEVSTYSGPAPLSVDFLGHGHDGDGDLLRYDWDFGDGTPIVTYVNVPADTNVFVAHTFATAGNFVVRLSVTDDGGLSHVNTVEIEVTLPDGGGGVGTNLLMNPGFEQGATAWAGFGTHVSVVTSPVHSGTRVARLVASTSSQLSLDQTVAVVPGTTYELSAWMRSEAVDGGAMIMVLWQDTAGRSLSVDRTNVVRGTNDWLQLAATLTAPSGAARGFVTVRLMREGDGLGTIWLDDVSVSAVN